MPRSNAVKSVATAICLAAAFCAFGGATPGYGTDAYVQKGLLAIWDGIENTGSSRQHDANITAWKDVVGDRAFALTGVTITEDGLVFDGSGASSRGVLATEDAAATFGLAGGGTMEIVIIPDETSGQRIALQGPAGGGAGLSIGIDASNHIYLQNTAYSAGVAYNWRGAANTFSVQYSAFKAVLNGSGVFRNGELVPSNLFGGSDFWGTPDAMAYVGGRARGDDGFCGKICCVRLYDSHLTAAEVAANAEVDRIRYRERPSADQIVIAGDPANYGSPTPGYGTQTVTPGDSLDFDVGETDLKDGVTWMHCLGHRILRMDVNGGWTQEGEDSTATSFSYAHDGTVARQIEWIWLVSRPLAVGTPEIVSARRLSAEFGICVDGAGYGDFGARLSLAWGTSVQQLVQTNVVATVRTPGVCHAHLTRTNPVDYYVRAVLEELGENGETVSVVTSEVVRLPADRIEDERTRAYATDGLVAWWDGIYNGGSSKTFESKPTAWKDVVGNVAFSMNGYAPSATGDSMTFTGEAGAYGQLSGVDTAQTFGQCANGTLEIVARGDRSDYQCIAVRGSDESGMAFGPVACRNGQLYFSIYASASENRPTVAADWNVRRTFAIRYDDTIPQDVSVDGLPYDMTSEVTDYWGRGGGDGKQAYLGNRADSRYPMDGEICAVRLYSRRLTDEEIVSNSLVDDNRFHGRISRNCLEIAGASYEYGSVSPAYGYYFGLKKNEQIVCTAPAEVQEGDMAATCTGWLLQTNAVGDASVWLPWRSGEGTECTYVNEDGASARLVWQWKAAGGGALNLGAIAFSDVRTDSMNVRASVLGIGDADSGTLKLRWGCSSAALENEASQIVSGMADVVFPLDGLLPGRRYFVQATLSTEGGDAVASGIVVCDTLEGPDPEGTRERVLGQGRAYVSTVAADGRPGDGVTVTGKVDLPAEAGDCAWCLLVWKTVETEVRRLAADDVIVDEEGNFSLTVVTDDPNAADYLQPNRQYVLSVETDLGGGSVSASSFVRFATAAASRFDGDSIKDSSKLRNMTITGKMLDVGAGGTATLTLLVGEDAESLAEVATTVVDADDLSFSFAYTVPTVERTYVWTVRSVNETAGRTACWTNTLPVASILIEDSAHYVWTGAAGTGRWCDNGNWQALRSSTSPVPIDPEDCMGYPCTDQASVSFPRDTAAVVDVDADVTMGKFMQNEPGANITFSSTGGKTLTLGSGCALGVSEEMPSVALTFDGLKVVAPSDVDIGNGCAVIFRNGAEISCSRYMMRFDNGTFNGGTGTNLTVVGAGCKIKTTDNIMLASGAECVVSNGTLEVGKNLLFNCETDGGTLRFEGERPRIVVTGDFRSTNEAKMLTASGGIVFDIPVGGYQSVPIVIQTATSSFGGTDAQACQPLHVNVVMKSGAYRNPKTIVYPLLSTAGTINTARQTFGELKRPAKSAFVYSAAVDEPVWLTRDELSPSAAPKLLGVRLGGAGGMTLRVR